MNTRILIAEDDADIVALLKLHLENSGYEVMAAAHGKQALELIQSEPVSLVLVDITMPEMNGYELIKEIRKTSSIPIIILSARDTDADKILGLDVGADACLSKPFNPLEVVAYVKALCRRCYEMGAKEQTHAASKTLVVRDLELDLEQFVLKKRGAVVPLTSSEVKVMRKFMSNPGRIFTKAQLYECVNGEYFENDDKTMMVHIYNIRAKLEDNPGTPGYIKTVRGLGYRLEAEEA